MLTTVAFSQRVRSSVSQSVRDISIRRCVFAVARCRAEDDWFIQRSPCVYVYLRHIQVHTRAAD